MQESFPTLLLQPIIQTNNQTHTDNSQQQTQLPPTQITQLQHDIERLQKIIKNLVFRHDKSINSNNQLSLSREMFTMDNDASSVLVEYINELTSSVIEEAALLARHRKSKEIDANDVNFILGK